MMGKRPECGVHFGLGLGKGGTCRRPQGHPMYAQDGVGHALHATMSDEKVFRGESPLSKPEPTDMPGHFMVRDGVRIYVLQEGALGQDEYCQQWRLTRWGWKPWDEPIYEWFGFPGAR